MDFGINLSTGHLLSSMLFGSVGFGFFIYGKKQLQTPQLVVGIVLMTYPYFVETTAAVIAIGTALIAGLWLALRVGA